MEESHARGEAQAGRFRGAVEVELEAEPMEQSYCWRMHGSAE
jgi:hypothetical protein